MITLRTTRAAITLALGLIACGRDSRYPDPNERLTARSKRLAAAVRQAGAAVRTVNFAEVFEFPWSRVYLFPPYTGEKRIIEALGFSWRDAGDLAAWLDARESICGIVFERGGAVVASFLHFRNDGDCSKVSSQGPFDRGRAEFRVELRGETAGGDPFWELREFIEPG